MVRTSIPSDIGDEKVGQQFCEMNTSGLSHLGIKISFMQQSQAEQPMMFTNADKLGDLLQLKCQLVQPEWLNNQGSKSLLPAPPESINDYPWA
jgi:hypothetical protein